MIKKKASKSIKRGVTILTKITFAIKAAILITVLAACSPMCPATLTAFNQKVSYRKSINDIIRNPKGVAQDISNKIQIVDNEFEFFILVD